jgi:hypothetical protein
MSSNKKIHFSKKTYNNINSGYINEYYLPPITLSLPQWRKYVANGYNTLYGDAIVSGGTEDDGAVYSGHVRQNPFTADI